MTHIYLRTSKKVTIIKKRLITVEDVALLEGPAPLVNTLNKLMVTTIPETDKKSKNYLISVMEVIHAINEINPDLMIHIVGENDIIIHYLSQAEKKENKFFTWIKVSFVALVLFVGSIVAIMTFQIDTRLAEVFSTFYFLILGDNQLQPYILEIPYAIGLAIGIIVFFNHFTKLKLSDDPTPIEVELNLYKGQVDDSIIETLTEEIKQKKDKKNDVS